MAKASNLNSKLKDLAKGLKALESGINLKKIQKISGTVMLLFQSINALKKLPGKFQFKVKMDISEMLGKIKKAKQTLIRQRKQRIADAKKAGKTLKPDEMKETEGIKELNKAIDKLESANKKSTERMKDSMSEAEAQTRKLSTQGEVERDAGVEAYKQRERGIKATKKDDAESFKLLTKQRSTLAQIQKQRERINKVGGRLTKQEREQLQSSYKKLHNAKKIFETEGDSLKAKKLYTQASNEISKVEAKITKRVKLRRAENSALLKSNKTIKSLQDKVQGSKVKVTEEDKKQIRLATKRHKKYQALVKLGKHRERNTRLAKKAEQDIDRVKERIANKLQREKEQERAKAEVTKHNLQVYNRVRNVLQQTKDFEEKQLKLAKEAGNIDIKKLLAQYKLRKIKLSNLQAERSTVKTKKQAIALDRRIDKLKKGIANTQDRITNKIKTSRGAMHMFGRTVKKAFHDAFTLEKIMNRMAFVITAKLSYDIFDRFRRGIVSVTKNTIKLNDKMSTVFTLLDENQESFKEVLTEEVIDTMEDYGTTIESTTRALYDLISARIPPEWAGYVLEQAARGALAGFTEIKVAGDALTTTLNSFNMEAREAGNVMDWLFTIIKYGKTTMEELQPNLGKVTSSANMLGISIEEVGAALATMTQTGIKTDIAITSLRQLMVTLADPTAKAKKLFEKYNIQMDLAKVKSEGLAYAVEQLAGLTDEEIVTIAKSRRGFQALAVAMGRSGTYAENFSHMMNRAGASSEAYQERVNSLQVTIDKLGKKLTAMGLGLRDTVVPVLTTVFSLLNDLLALVTSKWLPILATTIPVAIWGIQAGLDGIKVRLLEIGAGLKKLAIGLGKFLTNPYVIATVAITGLVTAIGHHIRKQKELRKQMRKMREERLANIGTIITEKEELIDLTEKYKGMSVAEIENKDDKEKLQKAFDDMIPSAEAYREKIAELTAELGKLKDEEDRLIQAQEVEKFDKAREEIKDYSKDIADLFEVPNIWEIIFGGHSKWLDQAKDTLSGELSYLSNTVVMQNLAAITPDYEAYSKRLDESIKRMEKAQESLRGVGEDIAVKKRFNAYKKVIGLLNKTRGSLKEMIKAQKNLDEIERKRDYNIAERDKKINELTQSYANNNIQLEEYKKRLVSIYEEYKDKNDEFVEQDKNFINNKVTNAISRRTEATKNRMDALKDAYTTEKEYNEYSISSSKKVADEYEKYLIERIDYYRNYADELKPAQKQLLKQLLKNLNKFESDRNEILYEDTDKRIEMAKLRNEALRKLDEEQLKYENDIYAERLEKEWEELDKLLEKKKRYREEEPVFDVDIGFSLPENIGLKEPMQEFNDAIERSKEKITEFREKQEKYINLYEIDIIALYKKEMEQYEENTKQREKLEEELLKYIENSTDLKMEAIGNEEDLKAYRDETITDYQTLIKEADDEAEQLRLKIALQEFIEKINKKIVKQQEKQAEKVEEENELLFENTERRMEIIQLQMELGEYDYEGGFAQFIKDMNAELKRFEEGSEEYQKIWKQKLGAMGSYADMEIEKVLESDKIYEQKKQDLKEIETSLKGQYDSLTNILEKRIKVLNEQGKSVEAEKLKKWLLSLEKAELEDIKEITEAISGLTKDTAEEEIKLAEAKYKLGMINQQKLFQIKQDNAQATVDKAEKGIEKLEAEVEMLKILEKQYNALPESKKDEFSFAEYLENRRDELAKYFTDYDKMIAKIRKAESESGEGVEFDLFGALGIPDLSTAEKRMAMVQNKVKEMFKMAQDWMLNYKLKNLQKQYEADLEYLNKQKEAEIEAANERAITEKHKQNQISAINEKYQEKESERKEKYEKERAKQEKKKAKYEATIDYVKALVSIWARELSEKGFGGLISAPILTGILTAFYVAQMAQINSMKFASGGYTGISLGKRDETGKKQAGIVHEREYVFPEEATEGNVSVLSSLHDALMNGKTFGQYAIEYIQGKVKNYIPQQTPKLSYASGGQVAEVKTQNININNKDTNERLSKIENVLNKVEWVSVDKVSDRDMFKANRRGKYKDGSF